MWYLCILVYTLYTCIFMLLCIYSCISVYTHAYPYTIVYSCVFSSMSTYTHTYSCISIYLCIHGCTCAYSYIFVHTCVYSCTHVHLCIYVCLYIPLYTCVYLCIPVYLHVYILVYLCSSVYIHACFTVCSMHAQLILCTVNRVYRPGSACKSSHISPSQRKRIIRYINVYMYRQTFICTHSFERSHWQWQVLLILSSYHECQSKRGGGWGGLNRVVYSWMWYTGSFAFSVDYTANQLQCRNVAQVLNLVLLSNQNLCIWITNQSMLIGW